MRRVLVTGATGFIGRAVVTPLQESGFEVHAIVRPGGSAGMPGVIDHHADLFDRSGVEAAVRAARASHLLHLAWDTEPGRFWVAPSNLDWVAASLLLVRSFVALGGERVVAAGTCAEYAWSETAPFSEHGTPCVPATLYGTAKDSLRRLLASFAAEQKLSFAWGRVFLLYGPEEKPGRLLGDAVRCLLAGRRFPTGDGRQRRDFIHVADAGRAFAEITSSGTTGAVNIGSGEAIPIATLLNEVARQTGRGDLIDIGARPMPAHEPPVIQADVTRLSNEVGFRPEYSLTRGIEATVARARETGL